MGDLRGDDRAKAERFLRRTPLAAALVDADGHVLLANDRLLDLLGIDWAELERVQPLGFIHPDDRDRMIDALGSLAGNDAPAAVQERARIRHADGTWLDLTASGVNLQHEPGFGGVLVTVTVTDGADDPAALPRRRGWFEAVVSNTNDIIQVVDEDGRFLWASGPVERVLGMPAQAMVGLTVDQVGTPDAQELTRAWFDSVLATPGPSPIVVGERPLFDRSGTVHLEVRATNLLHDPEVGGVVFMTRDISERLAAQEARRDLVRTEAHWRILSQYAHELLALVDADAVVQWAGPGFRTLLGLDPDSLVGHSIREIVHPDDRARPGGLQDLLAHRSGVFSRDYRVRHADGTWRVIDVDVTDLRDQPAVAALLVTGRDITERVAAEEANRRMAAAMESAGAAVVITDPDRKVLAWNREAERLSGQAAADVIGHHLAGGDAPELAEVRDSVMERLAAGHTVTYETERVLPDGRRLSLSVTASPIPDAAGNVAGFSYISFDVTEQRRAAAERDAAAAQSTALAELGQRALSGATVQDVLDDACELVARAIRVPHAHVVLLSSDARQHQLAAAVGVFADQIGRQDPVTARSWARHIDARRRPVLFEDFLAEDGPGLPPTLEGSSVRSGAVCAIDGRDGPIGSLIVLDDEPRAFGPTEVSFLQAIAHVLSSAVDRSRVSDEMQHRALHDELTNLPNRTLLLDRLSQAVGRIERREGTVGLLFVDLDRFKRVNDTLGHRAGDQVLVEVARRLLESVRAGDTVARTGGDEFLVLTEEIGDPSGAPALAQRVARAVADPMIIDGHGIHITASIGVAIAEPGCDAEELVRDADLAMYRAKQDGRDRIQIFDNSLRDEAMTRMAMEESLRTAVFTGSIEVVFQPQLRLDDDALIGIEALARWEHPRLGRIPPSDFVGLAEEIGVLDDITREVLRASCQATADARQVVGDLTASVNLTPRQLGRRQVIHLVDDALTAFALPPEALIIEVTETSSLDDTSALKVLTELRERGVRVSIDDFGTGYSSLARLTRLSVDEVKLDRSFVSGVVDDQGCAAVVKAVATLAGVLGIRLVAEGVESEAQRARLVELGCHEGQGWLFTGSLQAAELQRWIVEKYG